MARAVETKEIAGFPGRVPPHNIEAEQALLCSIMIDPEVMNEVVDIISPDDFYRPEHAIIYKCMLELYEKNEPYDLITLSDYIQKKNLADKIGGISYLVQLSDFVPTSARFQSYARIVKEKSIMRNIVRTASMIIEKCYEGEELENFIDFAERAFFEATKEKVSEGIHHISDVVRSTFRQVEAIYSKKGIITGIPSGFVDLDEYTAGFHNSDLIIVAGRPGMGKTAFALNICQHVAMREGVPCAIFSLEMSKEQLVMRMMCSEAMVDAQKLRTRKLTDREFVKLTEAAGRLSEAPIYIDDTPSISPMELRSKARRMKKEFDIGLIVVDYLQLMRIKDKKDTREQEISEISRSLKSIAKELDIPVIAISQLNRGVENRPDKRPQLADLRESGAIEQDADLILFIYRREFYFPEDEDARGKAEIIIGKQRNGPSGVSVHLKYFPEHTTFKNLVSYE